MDYLRCDLLRVELVRAKSAVISAIMFACVRALELEDGSCSTLTENFAQLSMFDLDLLNLTIHKRIICERNSFGQNSVRTPSLQVHENLQSLLAVINSPRAHG